MSTFLKVIRRGLSAEHRQVLDEVEKDPVVQSILEKASRASVGTRAAKVAELARVPAKHEKALKAAHAELMAATLGETQAEQAVAVARDRRRLAFVVAYGAEQIVGQEQRAIEAELRSTAPALLGVAVRAIRAFCLERHSPNTRWVANRRVDDTPWARHEHAAELHAADAANVAAQDSLTGARQALIDAGDLFDALQLEALSDSEVSSRVAGRLLAVNRALQGLKNSPHFAIVDCDIELRFGFNELAYVVKGGVGEKP